MGAGDSSSTFHALGRGVTRCRWDDRKALHGGRASAVEGNNHRRHPKHRRNRPRQESLPFGSIPQIGMPGQRGPVNRISSPLAWIRRDFPRDALHHPPHPGRRRRPGDGSPPPRAAPRPTAPAPVEPRQPARPPVSTRPATASRSASSTRCPARWPSAKQQFSSR